MSVLGADAGGGPGGTAGPTPGRRIAVCVSGAGSNLRALHARLGQGGLRDAAVVLVLADRPCPATDWAREQGLPVAIVDMRQGGDRAGWDAAVADALAAARPDLVVLAGFMRVLGEPVLRLFPDRILNVHPSLLPAFPGRDALGDALAAGVRVTGVTVHVVDATLDGGPIVAQEAVTVLPHDDRDSLAERIHAVEHRLLPAVVARALAGDLRVLEGRAVVERGEAVDLARRALLSVSDKTGLAAFATGLRRLGFELVSTGGTARALREAGLPVTDVATVTGFPEMLDGRVKTLHPRVAAGILADQRDATHRRQLADAAIDPFELVCVNLYRFADAAARPGVSDAELIEEIDIGGPTMVRAAAKNHGSVAIVTDPGDYRDVLDELEREGRVSDATRQRLALRAFELTAAYDATISWVLSGRLEPGPALRERVTIPLRLARRLRYGENPHQAAAAYLPGFPGAAGLVPDGPFSAGVEPLGGKELSYNNLLDAAAAARVARDLRGPACVIVKHTNPCGAAEANDLVTAWERALAGDPVSAFGGVVAVRGAVDAELAERLASMFLEVVVAAAFEPAARARLAERASLRLLAWPGILDRASAALEWRSVGGALLATEADVAQDDPATWRLVTSRAPDAREMADLDLCWRVCRHVASNAIVLVRDRTVVGVGAGQMSRVDSARLAVDRAGVERAKGAVCASDAFFPFPDALEVCAAAGVRAFVQPGGSQRDAEVLAAVESAGAAMLLTGTRHFRH